MYSTRYQLFLKWAGLKEDHGFDVIEICRHYGTTFPLWLQAKLIEWQEDVAPGYPGDQCDPPYRWLACDKDYKGEKSFESWLTRYVKKNKAPVVLTRKIAKEITQDLILYILPPCPIIKR